MEVINLAEAAQRSGISPGTATRWADRGKLPTIIIAGRRLVPVDQLNQVEPKSMKGRKPSLAKQQTPEMLEALTGLAELMDKREQFIALASVLSDQPRWSIQRGLARDDLAETLRALASWILPDEAEDQEAPREPYTIERWDAELGINQIDADNPDWENAMLLLRRWAGDRVA